MLAQKWFWTKCEKGIFFATRLGKQPCDGIGGTVKWPVSNASLKRDLKDQILSPSDMFQFCKKNIQDIIFKFIFKTDVDNTRVVLNKRFEEVTWIPGTRSFYEFSPSYQYSIRMKNHFMFITLKIKQNKILSFKY